MRLSQAIPAGLLAVSLTACGGRAADSTLIRESFDSGDTYSRTVPGAPAQSRLLRAVLPVAHFLTLHFAADEVVYAEGVEIACASQRVTA